MKRSVQMKQKVNFFVLLLFTLLSSVKAPLGGTIGASGLHVAKGSTTNRCDIIEQLFEAVDVRQCWNEFIEDAIISLFEKGSSKCKVFFKPDGKFIKKLAEGKKVPLNGLTRYAVYDRGWFKVVSVAGTEGKAEFYCSKERSLECKQLMPMKILGKRGLLVSCFLNWKGLEIARIDPMVMLTSYGWPRSVLIDPEFTLQGMPLMVRSKPWVPATIEYKGGQFKIETLADDQLYTERVSGYYIPYPYLDAVARIYRTMEMYGDLYYVPRTAPKHLHIKSCFPLNRLFLEADITPHEESEKPFEEFMYFFVPSNSFFFGTERTMKITNIVGVKKNSKDGFLVLTLTFRQKGGPATAAFYCAEAKNEKCEGLFTKILEIKALKGGLRRCALEWRGLTLERRKGRIEFKGAGMQPYEGLPLPQSILLLDLEWAKSKLDSRKKDKNPSTAIPEDYVKVVDYAYKKCGRWLVATPVAWVNSRLNRGIGRELQTGTQSTLQPWTDVE